MTEYTSWVCTCAHVNSMASWVCASCHKDRVDVQIELIGVKPEPEGHSLHDMVKKRLKHS